MNRAQTPQVPVSWGELVDKLTILDIKKARLTDPSAVGNVSREHDYLSAVYSAIAADSVVTVLRQKLLEINSQLWDVEDHIRDCEKTANFGPRFIELARSVYKLNDQRAAAKREINLHLRSELIEEKSYPSPNTFP